MARTVLVTGGSGYFGTNVVERCLALPPGVFPVAVVAAMSWPLVTDPAGLGNSAAAAISNVPITRKGDVTGVLYLENTLVSGAFTPGTSRPGRLARHGSLGGARGRQVSPSLLGAGAGLRRHGVPADHVQLRPARVRPV